MTLANPKQYYSRFLKAHEGKLHFAAHSHHFWPDVTREAHLQYWDDCAQLSDEKWSKIFSEVIPNTQWHIAQILGLKHPEQIVIAPNTHELSTRILSLFLARKSLSILTSTNEFHSWRRQFLRLSEIPEIKIEQVDSTKFLQERRNFIDNLKSKLQQSPDLCFISQVFFDSGLALTDDELVEISEATPKETILVIDGYHGFGAIPTNLSRLEGKIFYLSGGYKYAQAGEGVGFMMVPKGEWRPAYTGWFAEYAHLSRPAGSQVGYSDDGMAFMGATQDPSGCYRMNAVWDLFKQENISMEAIHSYVKELQKKFIQEIPQPFLEHFDLQPVFDLDLKWHGHFLTYESSQAEAVMNFLKSKNVLTDRRGQRIRFGFGLYQSLEDVVELCHRLKVAK